MHGDEKKLLRGRRKAIFAREAIVKFPVEGAVLYTHNQRRWSVGLTFGV